MRILLMLIIIGVASATLEDFLKVRCSTDGRDVFYTWSGKIFSYVPQEKPQKILEFVGYNVGRCVKINETWYLLSREISYYLDPNTHQRLDFWDNPFINKSVHVAHVANDPVNNVMFPVQIESLNELNAVIASDFPLYYPNPLHGNDSYAEYGGSFPYYEAGEFFKWYFSKEDLSLDVVKNVQISWSRVSPWMPWMKMGNIPGGVVYSCSGARATDIFSLPKWLVDDVKTRLPLFLHAPEEFSSPNESSQSYFMKHFDKYIAGEQFPIPTTGNQMTA